MNSGKFIKVIGILFLILMPLLVLISFTQSVVYVNSYGMQTQLEGSDILLLILAMTASLIPGLMIYGFGALVDSNVSMNRKLDTLIANSRQPQVPQPTYAPQNPYAPQSVPMAAAVPVTPVAPVAPVAPAAPAAPTAAPIIDEPTMVFPVLEGVNPQPPVVEVPTMQEPTGWICSNCGTQSPTLTPFCRNCGHQRV